MEGYRRLAALLLALTLLMTAALAEEELDNEDGAGLLPVVQSAAAIPDLDTRFLPLANASEPLEPGYVPLGLQSVTSRHNDERGRNENGGIYMASSASMHLVDEALSALKEMFAAAEEERIALYLRQGYRSYEDEVARYERQTARGEITELPGQSDYQTGLAVTVVGKSLRTKALTVEGYLATKEGQWVIANANRFGFVLRYPEARDAVTGHAYEPWHLRYVGGGAADYMTRNGLTLEEFRAELDAEVGPYTMPEGDTSVPAPMVYQPVQTAPVPQETPMPGVGGEDTWQVTDPSGEGGLSLPGADISADVRQTAEVSGGDSRYLLLASPVEPLAADYVPQRLVGVISRQHDENGIYMASSASMRLVDVALSALTEMFDAAEDEKITLYLRQGYRSYEDEAARYERQVARGEASELPGQSDYQTGLAATVVGKSLRTKTLTAEGYLATKEGQWVVSNASRFGFIVRYPEGRESVTGHAAEPWHLRYVGKEAAATMAADGLTLEEYRAAWDSANGPFVMPEGDASAANASLRIMPEKTQTNPVEERPWAAGPTPVPSVLPGGASILEETEDGDYEFSLFN